MKKNLFILLGQGESRRDLKTQVIEFSNPTHLNLALKGLSDSLCESGEVLHCSTQLHEGTRTYMFTVMTSRRGAHVCEVELSFGSGNQRTFERYAELFKAHVMQVAEKIDSQDKIASIDIMCP